MRTDAKTQHEVLAVLNGTWKAYAARDPEMVLSFYASDPNVLVLGSGPDVQYVGPKQARRAGRRPGRGTPRAAHGRAGEAARALADRAVPLLHAVRRAGGRPVLSQPVTVLGWGGAGSS
jgi:hypothetical protein